MSEISVAGESLSSPDQSESPSQVVVESVARAEGVDPLDIEVPLYEAIDPDALDALFRGEATVDGRVQFTYYGYDVTVTGSGHVTLEEALDAR